MVTSIADPCTPLQRRTHIKACDTLLRRLRDTELLCERIVTELSATVVGNADPDFVMSRIAYWRDQQQKAVKKQRWAAWQRTAADLDGSQKELARLRRWDDRTRGTVDLYRKEQAA